MAVCGCLCPCLWLSVAACGCLSSWVEITFHLGPCSKNGFTKIQGMCNLKTMFSLTSILRNNASTYLQRRGHSLNHPTNIYLTNANYNQDSKRRPAPAHPHPSACPSARPSTRPPILPTPPHKNMRTPFEKTGFILRAKLYVIL